MEAGGAEGQPGSRDGGEGAEREDIKWGIRDYLIEDQTFLVEKVYLEKKVYVYFETTMGKITLSVLKG